MSLAPLYRGPLATVYCGDAREVLPALPADSIDLMVVDPPYRADWQSDWRADRQDPIAGSGGALDVPATLALALPALRKRRHVYVFGYRPEDLREALRLGSAVELTWDKGMLGLGDLALPWGAASEPITFGVPTPSAAERAAGRGGLAARLRQGSVLRVDRRSDGHASRHPTEKPVALMRQLVESSSLLGEAVLDPFAGSGSTLVAAVLAGRRAVGVELTRKYAETAVERVRVAERLAAESSRV